MIPAHLDFKHLKTRVTIEQVLMRTGHAAKLRRTGPRLVGPCPIHGGDNTHAFVVHTGKNLWYCYTGCATGGDVVELVRRLCRLTYRQAAQFLATMAAIAPPPHAPSPTPRSASSWRPYTRRLRLEPNTPFLQAKRIWPSTARRFEAGQYHGRGLLQGCVGVRLHDPQGRPVGYAGRRLDPHQVRLRGKWVFPRLPKSHLLYNYHRAPRCMPQALVVVEDPWSVMRLHQLQIPAVALLGIALSQPQRRLLDQTPRVVLLLDGDNAGARAAARIRSELHTRVHVVALPNGADPDDLTDNDLLERLRHLPPLSF